VASIKGTNGKDNLLSSKDADVLNGMDGNDSYVFANSWGKDSIVDSSGSDTIDMSAVLAALNVNMVSITGNQVSDGSNTISWTGNIIENIHTGSGRDTVNGSTGDNYISTGAGSDAIWAGLGNDTIDGGEGNERYVYNGAWGNDSIIDSSGNDQLDFSTSTLNINFNLTSGNGNEVTSGQNTINWNDNVIENVKAGSGNDSIIGSIADNTLSGGAGNDMLNGSAGNDTLDGDIGNDTYLYTNAWGNDSILDVSGTDTLDMKAVTTALNIDMSTTTKNKVSDGTNTINWTGNIIENISTGSGRDTINGNSSDNYISTGAGSDAILAALGNDTMDGGEGNDRYVYTGAWGIDSILDSSGTDQLDFSTATLNVNFNLDAGIDSKVTAGTNVIKWTGDIIENVKAGYGNDNIIGNKADNVLMGGEGNDTLNGGAGNDSLYGGGGNDSYLLSKGNITIDDSGDHDQINLTDCNWASGAVTIQAADLLNKTGQAGTDGSYDSLVLTIGQQTVNILNYFDNSSGSVANSNVGTGLIEALNFSDLSVDFKEIKAELLTSQLLAGTDNDDELIGTQQDNNILGGLGNDTMLGEAGNDTYFFSSNWGNDSIYDAAGIDTVNLQAVTSKLFVSMDGGISSFFHEVSDGTNTIDWNGIAIENIISGSGDDQLSGNMGNNLINGGDGNDWISAQGGMDTLIGGNGDDRLEGSIGNDILEGGMGNDTYALFDEMVFEGNGIDTVFDESGTNDEMDFIIGITSGIVTGWQAFDSNNDHCIDQLKIVYADNETINIQNYFDNSSGSIANSKAGSGNIEAIRFSDTTYNFEDVLKVLSQTDQINSLSLQGTSGDDQLRGGLGNDTIQGMGGMDTIHGLAGDDVITGGGSLNFIFGDEGNDIINGGTATLKNSTITYLNGGLGNDTVYAGNDYEYSYLSGGVGNDTLVGSDGFDSFVFRKGDGHDFIQNIASANQNDEIRIEAYTDPANIAFYMDNGTLEIGFTDTSTDILSIQKAADPLASYYNVLIITDDGHFKYTDSSTINQVISEMSAYAVDHGIQLNSLNDVKQNSDLLSIIHSHIS
jgi:Ca2+-binding RTX toxin-like protein